MKSLTEIIRAHDKRCDENKIKIAKIWVLQQEESFGKKKKMKFT